MRQRAKAAERTTSGRIIDFLPRTAPLRPHSFASNLHRTTLEQSSAEIERLRACQRRGIRLNNEPEVTRNFNRIGH